MFGITIKTQKCKNITKTRIHTYIYIYFLLRQVGLRQPKGRWGPARNLILKLQKFTKKKKKKN